MTAQLQINETQTFATVKNTISLIDIKIEDHQFISFS